MIILESKNVWNKCLEIIKDNVNDKAFNTWFLPIIPINYDGNDFTIQVPSHFFYEYIEEQYAHLIHSTLTRITGKNLIINYRVFVDNSDKKKGHTTIPSDRVINSDSDIKMFENKINIMPATSSSHNEWESHLNDRFSFDNFIEGPSNILARSIGQSIAEQPGKTFSPMYVYGTIGVGKTHLCHAIGNRIRKLHPDKKVIYVSALLFQVQFTDAVKHNVFNDFINFYQNVDVLIIDDIQEFIGKDKTQQAYFHIFNHLHNLKKQLVLTSDKSPAEMDGLEDRMITRMKWGMTAELQKPDVELRKSILRDKIKHNGLILSEEVINFIAENVTEQVRDLEGIVTSLVAHSLVYEKEIDVELANKVIAKIINIKVKVITVEKILNTVSSYFRIDLKNIHSKSRKQEVVKARHIAMYLAKKHTNYSYAHIGSLIGKRDHATVLHAINAIKNLLEFDKSLPSVMNELEILLNK